MDVFANAAFIGDLSTAASVGDEDALDMVDDDIFLALSSLP